MNEPELYWYKAKITRVVDGDTFDAMIDLGFKMIAIKRIRLACVDTPETYGVKQESEEYKKGKEATEFVIDWFNSLSNEVYLRTEKEQGKYGRYIAHVWNSDRTENLGDVMVEKGLAEKKEY